MTLSVHASEGSAKQVELNSELSAEVAIHLSKDLVRGKNVLRVVHKVKDRNQILIADTLYPRVCKSSLLWQ